MNDPILKAFVSIPVDLIDPPAFNSRVYSRPDGVGAEVYDSARIKELAESMNVDGQQQPIKVEDKDDGRYELVFGSRRLAAAKLLKWTDIKAEIVPATDERTRVLVNGIENVQRENLSTFELGRLCAKLRELKFKGKEIASRLGLSESHISNVAVCYEMLPPDIKTKWQNNDPAADVSFLRSLINRKDEKGKVIGRTPEEMRALWNERVESLKALEGAAEDDDEDDDEDDKGSKSKSAKVKSFTVPRTLYKAVLTALRNGKHPKIATDVARFLVGDIAKVPGLNVEVPE